MPGIREFDVMAEANVTTDHETIRRWAEARGAHPATVKATKRKDEPGVLRFDFEPQQEEGLEPISWDEFFDKFDDEKLAFLYQDKTDDGSVSRFHKFVNRSTAKARH
jgi:hypothetical protein